MGKIFTCDEMRAVEQGFDSACMIQTAGTHACEAILRWEASVNPRLRTRYLVLAGPGKNGADARVVAQGLHAAGRRVILTNVVDGALIMEDMDATEKAGDCLSREVDIEVATAGTPSLPPETQSVCAEKHGNPVEVEAILACLNEPGTVLVDGLFGIGYRSRGSSIYTELLAKITTLPPFPCIALDIPSGLNADTGEACADGTIRADVTLTMGAVKRGMVFGGAEWCGAIEIMDIGIPEECFEAAVTRETLRVFDWREARQCIRPRPMLSHKNSFGRILLLAGSEAYSGAPFLAAMGALRAGGGVTRLVLPSAARKRSGPAALIVEEIPQCAVFEDAHVELVQERLAQTDAVLFGPGVSLNASTAVLTALLNSDKPLVLDADALRILARQPNDFLPFIKQRTAPLVLTPHPGEMTALLQAFCPRAMDAPRNEQALALAKCLRAVVVLKGHHTMVAAPDGENDCTVNLTGGPALATPGTGDVLAGIITALLAQMPAAQAARLGVFIHGLAADSYNGSPRAMIADDLAELLPIAFAKLSLW